MHWIGHLIDPARVERPLLAPSPAGIDAAADNALVTWLWQALARDGAVDDLAPLLRFRIKELRDREIAIDLQSHAVAVDLAKVLRGEGIRVIALKGLALRSALYRPQGWPKGPGDIDLMVPSDRLEDAEAILDAEGFLRLGKYPPEFYRTHHHCEPRTLSDKPSVLIDLHRSPVKTPHPFHLDLEGLWSRALPLEEHEDCLERLDDLDLTIHLAMQLDHDDVYSGKVRSLSEMLAFAHYRRLDGRSLSARAHEHGAADAVARSFGLGSRLLGVAGPAGLPVTHGPPGLRGPAWRAVVDRILWRRRREGGVPIWYLNYASEILVASRSSIHAIIALMKPVISNPRLGGRGFSSDRGSM